MNTQTLGMSWRRFSISRWKILGAVEIPNVKLKQSFMGGYKTRNGMERNGTERGTEQEQEQEINLITKNEINELMNNKLIFIN